MAGITIRMSSSVRKADIWSRMSGEDRANSKRAALLKPKRLQTPDVITPALDVRRDDTGALKKTHRKNEFEIL